MPREPAKWPLVHWNSTHWRSPSLAWHLGPWEGENTPPREKKCLKKKPCTECELCVDIYFWHSKALSGIENAVPESMTLFIWRFQCPVVFESKCSTSLFVSAHWVEFHATNAITFPPRFWSSTFVAIPPTSSTQSPQRQPWPSGISGRAFWRQPKAPKSFFSC